MFRQDLDQRLAIASWGLHAAGTAGVCLILLAGWSLRAAMNWQIAGNQTQEELARMFLASAEKIMDRHQSTQERCALLKGANDALLARIPDAPQEAEFLGLLTELAEQCGLTLNEFRPGPHVARESCTEFDVQLAGRGPYDGVCLFLAGIDGLPRLCKLNDLRLAVADEAGEECQVELRLIVPFSLKLVKPEREVKP